MADIVNFPAFLLAALALCAFPGPDFVYILGRTMAQGRRAAVVSALGIMTGSAGHILAASLGLSAFLAASAGAFLALKYVGAAYLVYLGAQTLRSGGVASPERKGDARRDRELFLQGMLTDLSNPKVALFFLAFLPQFISPQCGRPLLTFLLLGGIVLAIGLTCDMCVVFCSDHIIRRLRGNATFARVAGRTLGGVLIGLGLTLACEKN